MERWRSFFEKSRADIWTVIHEAITVAAVDYPKDFRERRVQIAETLFDRSLLQRQFKDEPSLICKDGEGRKTSPVPMLKAPSNVGDIAVCRKPHDDAEALSNELEEEALILRDIQCIKGTLAEAHQPENVILEALQRLQYVQITVDNLKATEIGKDIRSLKKHTSKRVQALARELMRQWKALIDEWILSVKDVTTDATTATTGTECGDCIEDGNHGAGLLALPLDEGAHLEARAPTMDLSQQLFSFVDGEDLCTGFKGSKKIPSNSIEPSVKDNLSYLCRSQSTGSMLTESSEFDTKASGNCPWGLITPEERGSATPDMYPRSGKLERDESGLKGQVSRRGKSQIDSGVQMSKCFTNVSGPGRLSNKNSKAQPVLGLGGAKATDIHDSSISQRTAGVQMSKSITTGSGPGRPFNENSKAKPVLRLGGAEATTIHDSSISWRNDLGSSVTTHADRSCAKAKPTTDYDRLNQMSAKIQVDRKLEISKRKLHQGYEQAENAKKQRTVQLLDPSELPDSRQVRNAKLNGRVHNKEHSSFGHGGKAKANVCT